MKHLLTFQTFAFVLASFANASNSSDVLVRSNVGNPCVSSEECGDGYHCIEERAGQSGVLFSGGYCVQFECSRSSPCDAGAACLSKGGVSLCLARCETDAHCRNGYTCQENGVCLPG
jgi:hypothetical protein